MHEPPSCPVCGATGVHGQLVPKKNLGRGLLVEWLTGDTAAALMATQMGDLVVYAFCVACGAQWLPGTEMERHLRALSGQLGEEAKREAEPTVRRYANLFNCPGCSALRPQEGSAVNLYGVRYCAACTAGGKG